MRKIWHDDAWEEYLAWQRQDPKTLKRIQADRIVFRIQGEELEILSCKGHYA